MRSFFRSGVFTPARRVHIFLNALVIAFFTVTPVLASYVLLKGTAPELSKTTPASVSVASVAQSVGNVGNARGVT